MNFVLFSSFFGVQIPFCLSCDILVALVALISTNMLYNLIMIQILFNFVAFKSFLRLAMPKSKCELLVIHQHFAD
jgi:hypothetical protein